MFTHESENAHGLSFQLFFLNEGLLEVTASHIHCKCGNISETLQDRIVFCSNDSICTVSESLLLQTTNRKWYMAYQIEAIPMTLSDLRCHSPTASLFKCDFFVQQCSSWQLSACRAVSLW